MNETITFMSRQIERKRLFSKVFIIALLEDEGPNFATLANVRSWYENQFGNDLCWNYPFSQGMHNGILLLPVQEGFLALPYIEVDAQTFEQFELSSAELLTVDAVDVLEKELMAYIEGLLGALSEMRIALSPDGKGAQS